MEKPDNYIIMALRPGEDSENELMVLAAKELTGVPEFIQLVPPGLVEPKGWPPFVNDAEARRLVLADWYKRKNHAVIDYEHQNLKGTEAPAAGWITDLEDRGDGTGGGIWGRVEWTEKAAGYLKNREYRFISPVIFRRKVDDRVMRLDHAALTNDPAIDGMVPVVNKNGAGSPTEEEEVDMNWLKTLLGLPETATEEQVQTACKARFGLVNAVMTALALKADAAEADVTAAVEALKAPAVPGEIVEALGLGKDATISVCKGTILSLKNATGGPTRQEFEALKTRQAEKDAEEAITAALKSGKITPAMVEGWGRKLAKEDPDAFAAYCKSTAEGAFVTTKELGGGGLVATGAHGLTETEAAICKQMGIKPEDYKKTKGGTE